MGSLMSSMEAEYRLITTPVDFDPFSEGELVVTVPMTEAQKEIWLATQMGDAANCAFNESIGMWLRGALDVRVLNEALQGLASRHDALRSVLTPDGETLCVLAAAAADFKFTDFSLVAPAERRDQLDKALRNEVTTPFDLVTGPLFRSQLVKLQAEEHCLILTAHHIICDGWSWGIILSDLVELYSAGHQGLLPVLPAAESFSAFALAQHKQTMAPETVKAESYWLKTLSGTVPTLDLPTDQPRPKFKTYNAARQDYRLPVDLVKDLKRLGAQHKCTLFTTLLAGFTLFLHRITRQRDVFVGITVAGQLSSGQHHLVGHCVNLLPFRTSMEGAMSFTEYLAAIHRTLLDAYGNQQVTFGRLLKSITLPRDPSRLPWLPVRFNLAREMGARSVRTQAVEFEMFTNPRKFENFEIFLDAMEIDGALMLECYYNTDLFSEGRIEELLKEFEGLLRGIVTDPDLPVTSFPPLPKVDHRLTQKLHVRPESEAATQAPAPGSVELQLVEIWKQVLRVARVNLNDDFFELGGNSYRAAQLSRAIDKSLGQQLPLVTFFEAVTVRQQADVLHAARSTPATVMQGKAGR